MNAEVLENTAGELTGEDAEVSEDPYAGMTPEEAEKAALENELSQKWMEGKSVRKVIVVPGKIVNIVLG